MNRTFKRIALAVFALCLSAGAFAQVLAPFITGTNSEHRREIFEVGMYRLNQTNNTLTALVGGAQAGTQLNLGFNRFTTVTSVGDSAQLPVLPGANIIFVVNATTNSMNIFPQTGGTINALSANAAFALAAGKAVIFIEGADGNWYGNLSA